MVAPVKWFTNAKGPNGRTMAGAPTLDNTVTTEGTLSVVLKTCLVDGFNQLSPSTVTYDDQTDLVTVTYLTTHGHCKYQIIEMSGCTETEYNGEWRVLSVPDDNTLTYRPTSAPLAATATGSPSTKAASAGWNLVYENNPDKIMVLEPGGVNSNGYQILLDGKSSTWYDTTEYQWMEQVTVVRNFVTENDYELVKTFYWFATTWRSDNNEWYIVADDLLFYMNTNFTGHYNGERRSTILFGDGHSIVPGDAHFTLLVDHQQGGGGSWTMNYTGATTSYFSGNDFHKNGDSSYRWIMAGYHQMPIPTPFLTRGLNTDVWGGSFGYPNMCNRSLQFAGNRMMVCETTQTGWNHRGYLPGMIEVLGETYEEYHGEILSDLPGLPGGLAICLYGQQNTQASQRDYPMWLRLDDWRDVIG